MGRGEVSGGKQETFEWRTENPWRNFIHFCCVDSIMKKFPYLVNKLSVEYEFLLLYRIGILGGTVIN